MDPEVLGDLVAPARRTDAVSYRHAEEPARLQRYDSLCTTAWQTANLMRLYGVHAGATVGIVDAPKHPDGGPPTDMRGPSTDAPGDRGSGTPIPEVITAFLGASLLGAVVRFDPHQSFDGSALLCPAAWTGDYELSPGCTVLAYGGPPTDSSVVHFESEVWSETPIAPPESVSPTAPVLAADKHTFDHATLLGAATDVVDEHGVAEGDAVAIDASFARPGTVVAGVIAPLLVGGSIQVGGGDVTHRVGDVGIDPAAVTLCPSDGRSSRV
ncbi:hypothetical protein [Halorhabdus rudnickae]|uniref:hypothetical protein n=1 Tax=Halorhabdus rudnickae TaxID=1775544 RepID=UPI0010833F97|nr:hypothetical protein [Halorhabdus rudnickae]